jgi:ribonuclease HII
MANIVIPPPTLDIERELLQQGVSSIAGADEAGVGALAGPIVVGMVQLPLPAADTGLESELESELARLLQRLKGVRDTSHLRRREWPYWVDSIRALGQVGIGQVSSDELNAGLSAGQALNVAYQRALDALPHPPRLLLIDGGIPLPPLPVSMRRVRKVHDTPSLSIACAAVVAALSFHQTMQRYDLVYPGYGFNQHRGYASPRHEAALATLGPSPIHRRSNAMVQRALLATQGRASE